MACCLLRTHAEFGGCVAADTISGCGSASTDPSPAHTLVSSTPGMRPHLSRSTSLTLTSKSCRLRFQLATSSRSATSRATEQTQHGRVCVLVPAHECISSKVAECRASTNASPIALRCMVQFRQLCREVIDACALRRFSSRELKA